MTEASGLIAMQTRDSKRIDSIGQIVPGITMKVLDVTSGRQLGPNEQGELCFKLDNIMLGYYNKEKETKEMIDKEGI